MSLSVIRFRKPGRVAALAVCLALAAVPGCVRSQAPEPLPQPQPLSSEAELTYDYLVYQDAVHSMESIGLSTEGEEAKLAKFTELQTRAADALTRIIAQDPTAMLYAELGSLYFNLRQVGQAKSILREGLDKYPGDRLLTTVLASAYLLEGDTDSAVDTVESYLTTSPDDHEVRQRLAEMLIDAMEYDQAVKHLERIPADQRSATTYFLLGRSLSRLSRVKQAEAALNKAIAMEPEYLEAWAELAFLHETARNYQAAVRDYSTILDLGGPEEEVRLRLISLDLKMNKPDEALQTALGGPGQKSFLLSAAVLFIDEGFPAQASAVLDVLADSDPVPGEYYYYKAYIAFQAEDDPDKALEYLGRVDPQDPHYDRALQFRVQLLHQLGRDDEAVALIDDAARRYPDEARFVVLHSEILAAKGDFAGAAAVVDKALQQAPTNTELLYRLGSLQEKAGQREQAMATMERILEIEPSHADALNFLGYTLADEGRDLDRALVLVRQALAQDPDNGYVVDSLAWVYFRQGQLDRAWAEISRAVELVKGDPTLWEHYGDIAKAMGKKITAVKAYQKALRFGHEEPERIKKKIEGL